MTRSEIVARLRARIPVQGTSVAGIVAPAPNIGSYVSRSAPYVPPVVARPFPKPTVSGFMIPPSHRGPNIGSVPTGGRYDPAQVRGR